MISADVLTLSMYWSMSSSGAGGKRVVLMLWKLLGDGDGWLGLLWCPSIAGGDHGMVGDEGVVVEVVD